MKTLKYIFAVQLLALVSISCSSDDDSVPAPINEEEVITTMTVTLTPSGGLPVVTLQSQDLDGDGPDAPVVTVSGNLLANTSYAGTVELLNETESPAESINEEIEEEAGDHQFFFQNSGSLNLTTTYADMESDYTSEGGTNPVGINFTVLTGNASSGSYTVTLRHEPNKDASNVSDGDITNAAGETDFAQTFNVTIQ